MAELLATLGTGLGIDAALGAAYGFGIDGLENLWRASVGAEPYIPPTPGPTPTPAAEATPAYKLLTLPPESGGSEPESEAAESTEPTQLPEPTIEQVVAESTVEPLNPDASEDPVEEQGEEASGGTCSAPVAGSIDGTAGAWLIVVVGLAAGGRYRSQKKAHKR